MWANSLLVNSSSRTNRNANSEKYIVTCTKRITTDNPTTNEWITIVGTLKKTNQRDLNRVLKGILEKKKAVAIKISASETLQKEYTIASVLKTVPGFIRPYCFFQCDDDYRRHPASGQSSLCRGPGTSMGVLVMPYMEEGSMRMFDWLTKPVQLLHSCLTQLFCSLMQAYESKRIIHSDTHLDNVLLRKTTVTEIEYSLGGKLVRIPTNGYMIAIMDFELSFNEMPTNRGRAIGQVYNDLVHAVSDLSYESSADITNAIPLTSKLLELVRSPIPMYDAFRILKPLIDDIGVRPKIVQTFVYDPSVFG